MTNQLIPFMTWQATCSKCGYKGDAKEFPVLLELPVCRNCYFKRVKRKED